MKKVLNWTIGSFFRTIGRTIAFLVMGGLIYYLLSYNGIGISDLFFDKVEASEFQGIWPNNVQAKVGANGTYQNKNMTDNDMYTLSFANSQQNNMRVYWKFDQVQLDSKAEYLYVAFALSKTLGVTTTCSITTSTVDCGDWEYTLQVGYWYNNNEDQIGICNATQVVSNMIYYSCPIKSTNINGFRIGFDSSEVSMYSMSFSPFMTYTLANLSSGMQQIIDKQNQTINAITNQTQQDQQQHEEMMDSNTTEAEEEASSFFDNFEAPDIGGLSAIVTAPLTTIQSLLNSTCTNLQLPLPYVNKTLTLPCMNSIYTEHFGAFFSIYQTIMLAIIAYRCIRSIFFDIHGFTNPSDDRIEVMDL